MAMHSAPVASILAFHLTLGVTRARITPKATISASAIQVAAGISRNLPKISSMGKGLLSSRRAADGRKKTVLSLMNTGCVHVVQRARKSSARALTYALPYGRINYTGSKG